MNIKYLVFTSLFILMGCSREGQKVEDEFIMDLNSDGTKDVFYEFDDSGYFELVDRNFDGRVDESIRYDKDNIILLSKIDEDFDGYLETKIYYKHQSIEKVGVDLDGDDLYEIIYFYKSGTLEKGFRYYQEGELRKIGRISFRFGYPEKAETIEVTEMEKTEFQKINRN